MPSRTSHEKRSDEVIERYKRIDELMAWIENIPCYENFYLSDDVIGIAGSKWDGNNWSYEQRNFLHWLVQASSALASTSTLQQVEEVP
eukprot:10962702-Ditylum_brightwellii.AAC.1